MKYQAPISGLNTPRHAGDGHTGSTPITLRFPFLRCIVIDFSDHGMLFHSDDHDLGVQGMGCSRLIMLPYWSHSTRFHFGILLTEQSQHNQSPGYGGMATRTRGMRKPWVNHQKVVASVQGSYQDVHGCYDMDWEVAFPLLAFVCGFLFVLYENGHE